ncbi:MAG: hypothetical protein A3J79_10430 [Elusimicrobia bacterium RIFOXYB2_FULL_62_6]|nr:MAG: hypothetical protein A3J79_10430 [Elusimicrobia bacterium RIFOXYB2_FULL_62_6]
MNISETAPAGKTSILGATAASLTALVAWFLCAAALLALSTFLPPLRSMLVLALVFIAAGVLSFLFCRWAPVRETLEAIKGGGAGAEKKSGPGRLFGALAVLAAAALLVVLGARGVWHGRLESFKQDLKEKGLPLSLAEFQEDLPDGQYAYPELSTAIEKDFSPEFYNKAFHTGDSIGKWTPEIFKKEAPYAAHYAPYLDKKLAPLLARKYTRYLKVDYAAAAKEPSSMPAPPLANMLSIARAAKLYAVSRAYQGDAGKAWALVRLQFSLADLLADEKVIYSKIIALGLRRLAVETALDIMLNRPAATLPADLTASVKGVLGGVLIRDALKSELAYQFDEYAFLSRLNGRRFVSGGGLFTAVAPDSGRRGGGLGMWLEYEAFSVMRMLGLLDINLLATARYFAELTGESPWAIMFTEGRMIGDEIQKLPSWPYLLVKAALPEFSRMYEREWELKAWAQLALACSELNRFRAERGRYPKDISELSPKTYSAGLLRDIFSGGKLPYTLSKDGKSFELCSTGAYGKKQDAFGRSFCIKQ